MGTQAVISITSDGETVLKVVSGCDGSFAQEAADAIRDKTDLPLEDVYNIVREHLGCDDCLVVMDADETVYKGADGAEYLDRAYRDTFCKPAWNPRWKYGTADYTIVMEAIK